MLAGTAKTLLSQVAALPLRGLQLAVASGSHREYSQIALSSTIGSASGPGGRSSVAGATVTVFGANGFVGKYVVSELGRRGCQIVCPYRCVEEQAMPLRQMADLGGIVLLKDFDLRDDEKVKYYIHRSNVVVNLIGKRLETMNYSWEDIYTDWPKRLAKIAAASPNVERLVHFSWLGAHAGHGSRRLRAIAAGEDAVRKEFPAATVIKPGPIVGEDDKFYNQIIWQLSNSPIVPMFDDGEAKLSPTYISDVAEAVVRVLQRPETAGQTYHLAAQELTYRQLYEKLREILRTYDNNLTFVPKALAKMAYAWRDEGRRLLPALPGASYTKSAEYVEEVTTDAVVPAGGLGYADLDMQPMRVTEGQPIEAVRTFRQGGYSFGDLKTLAKDTPEHIRKYYMINK